jgi:hypothetical protein
MSSAANLFFDFIGWAREALVEATSSPYSDGVDVPPGRPAGGEWITAALRYQAYRIPKTTARKRDRQPHL